MWKGLLFCVHFLYSSQCAFVAILCYLYVIVIDVRDILYVQVKESFNTLWIRAPKAGVGCALVCKCRIDIHNPQARFSSSLPARLWWSVSVPIAMPDARVRTVSSFPTWAHSLAVFQVHWKGDTHATSVDRATVTKQASGNTWSYTRAKQPVHCATSHTPWCLLFEDIWRPSTGLIKTQWTRWLNENRSFAWRFFR